MQPPLRPPAWALVSLLLAIFHKQFSGKMLYDSVVDTVKPNCMVFILLFGTAAFTGIFMSLDGDKIVTNMVMAMGAGKIGAIAIMMVIVFIMGIVPESVTIQEIYQGVIPFIIIIVIILCIAFSQLMVGLPAMVSG